jgi:hypothetical protein
MGNLKFFRKEKRGLEYSISHFEIIYPYKTRTRRPILNLMKTLNLKNCNGELGRCSCS